MAKAISAGLKEEIEALRELRRTAKWWVYREDFDGHPDSTAHRTYRPIPCDEPKGREDLLT